MNRKATSADVAKLAGVSRGAVSAVLNHTPGIRISKEKRQAVLQAIEALNYTVDAQARGMRTGKTRCIGAYGNLDNPLFLQVLEGVQKVCRERGYQLMLLGADSRHDRKSLMQLYRQRRIDGLITKDSTRFADPEWAAALAEAGMPYVSVEGYPEQADVASVLMDYEASIRLALDYMYSRTGLAPVYFELYSGPEYVPNWGDRRRRTGYEAWMREQGLSPQIWSVDAGLLDRELRGIEEWLEALPQPAAILSNWFRGAMTVYRAAYRSDWKIGSNLFVMAADNTEGANEFMVPALSAVEVPYEEMGETAAMWLIESLELAGGRAVPDKLWTEPKLVSRESV